MATDNPVRDLLLDAFERVHEEIPQIVEGLSPEQLLWRPDAEANSIAWLVWHLARVQDDHLAGLSTACGRTREQRWQTWASRFDLPYDHEDVGYGHDADQVAAFTVADPALLTGYHADVHALTAEILDELGPEDLGRVVDENWDPPTTAAVRLVSVVNDITAHTGQAAYLAGLLRRRSTAQSSGSTG